MVINQWLEHIVENSVELELFFFFFFCHHKSDLAALVFAEVSWMADQPVKNLPAALSLFSETFFIFFNVD